MVRFPFLAACVSEAPIRGEAERYAIRPNDEIDVVSKVSDVSCPARRRAVQSDEEIEDMKCGMV
jgi:hypothetical protein